jgi:hypothetical protein
MVVKFINVALLEEVEQLKYWELFWVLFNNKPGVQYDPTGKGKLRFAFGG